MTLEESKRKVCPLLAVAHRNGGLCVEAICAMWNPHLGCCGLIAEGLATGIEIHREELREDMHCRRN